MRQHPEKMHRFTKTIIAGLIASGALLAQPALAQMSTATIQGQITLSGTPAKTPVQIVATNKATGVVMDERSVVGTTSFYATGSDSVSQDVNQDERQAVPLAAQDMAVQLVSQYAEGW